MATFDVQIQPDQARQLAADILISVYPMMLADAVRRTHPVTPNRTMLLAGDSARIAPGLLADPYAVQTSTWIDLADGPVTFSIAPAEAARTSFSLITAWGIPVPHSVGVMEDDHTILLVGPNWREPPAASAPTIRAPTASLWFVSRTLVDEHWGQEASHHISGVHFTPLDRRQQSGFEHQRAPTLALPTRASTENVAKMAVGPFLHRAAMLLARHGLPQEGDHLLGRLAQVGVTLGQPYTPPPARSDLYNALVGGMADGLARISRVPQTPLRATSWRVLSGRADHDDALGRAAAAMHGLGAPEPEDILDIICETDEQGAPLTGSERYELQFDSRSTPPAKALWSLATFQRTPAGALILQAPHAVGKDRIRPYESSGFRILVEPGPARRNDAERRLAAPAGEFGLILRLYRPERAAFTAAWSPPAVIRHSPSSTSMSA